MAFWNAHDSAVILLRRWLDAVRAQHALADAPDKAWRPLDSENTILAKILRSLCEAYGLEDAYRFNDTENDLLRKILAAMREGVEGLPSGAAHEWRGNDTDRELLAKILRCLCIDAANTDPQNDFLPGDSEMVCLRKIVAIF